MEREKIETPKQALTRDAICNAALNLFAENGIEQTTVQEIATAAGPDVLSRHPVRQLNDDGY